MRHRILISARAILLGWVSLFALTYLVERPLLAWTAPILGASWLPTAQLALACAGLAVTGWIVGRGNRFDVLIFAAMLAAWNFGLAPAINVPWLVRLAIDSFGNSRYLESLITAVATHALLFGSLITGARLSRPAQSIATLQSR